MGWFFLQEKYAFCVVNILGKTGSDNETINQLSKYIYIIILLNIEKG